MKTSPTCIRILLLLWRKWDTKKTIWYFFTADCYSSSPPFFPWKSPVSTAMTQENIHRTTGQFNPNCKRSHFVPCKYSQFCLPCDIIIRRCF